MSKYAMDQLKELLCRELDEIAEKGELSAGDLETAHKLTDTVKNILKINALEDGTYSEDDGYMRNSMYNRGSSYRRDSRGRYSRNYARGSMMDHLDAMMMDAKTQDEREMIERFRREIQH